MEKAVKIYRWDISETDSMKENLRLKRENEELRKEIAFLKSGGILCKGNRLEAYRFIGQHHEEFGTRWLLRRLGLCPNVCYNYRKHRLLHPKSRSKKSTTATTE